MTKRERDAKRRAAARAAGETDEQVANDIAAEQAVREAIAAYPDDDDAAIAARVAATYPAVTASHVRWCRENPLDDDAGDAPVVPSRAMPRTLDERRNPTAELQRQKDGRSPGLAQSATAQRPLGARPQRLVCRLQNAGPAISGVTFATVPVGPDGEPTHVSEHVSDEAKYQRFLTIPGYEPWAGDEDQHGATIEDGLEASRQTIVATGGAASTVAGQNALQDLADQRASNVHMAERMRQLAERAAALEAENADLKRQVQQLKAAAPVA